MHDSVNKFAYKSLLTFAIALATLAGLPAISGCHKGPEFAVLADNSGPDPADANMAPVDASQQPAPVAAPTRVLPQRIQNESQQRAEEYAQAGTPKDQQDDQNYENEVEAGQEALEEASTPPPPLPVYEQPEAPAPNYIWTPGYWSYAPTGYYWVPGAWCAAPYYGALWTPGYWFFYRNHYRFHRGFWGLHIGYYGGVNYGFGYVGTGYRGGYWNGNNFYYNRAVNRINTSRITNVYNRAVVVNSNTNRVSYNGGRGGLNVRPQPAELAAMRGPRTPPMTTQIQNQREASQNRQQFFNQNGGRPAIVAAPRPILADKSIQRPEPRPMPQLRPNEPGQPGRPQIQPMRPGTQPQVRPRQPEVNPGQPQLRPGAPQTRPVQPQIRPVQPQYRPGQPQLRPEQPQPGPTQPQPRPGRPQVHSDQPFVRPTQPQVRPDRPQLRPNQPQIRPEQRQQRSVQPRPQPMQRPTQQQPEPRPQPQSRQAQAPKPESRQAPRQEDNRPR